MTRYKLVVFTNARDDRDEEFNRWYNDVHLGDVVDVPGFVSAQRFRLHTTVAGELRHRYLAIYEIETDAPQAAIDALLARRGTEVMALSDALDVDGALTGLFEPCSPVVTRGAG